MREKFLRFQDWSCQCGHRFSSICYTGVNVLKNDNIWLQPVDWEKSHHLCPKCNKQHFGIVFGENVTTGGTLVVWGEIQI